MELEEDGKEFVVEGKECSECTSEFSSQSHLEVFKVLTRSMKAANRAIFCSI